MSLCKYWRVKSVIMRKLDQMAAIRKLRSTKISRCEDCHKDRSSNELWFLCKNLTENRVLPDNLACQKKMLLVGNCRSDNVIF